VEHSVEVQVINELSAASQQSEILDAFQRLPDKGIIEL
jgi:hypothetical protein